MALTLARPGGGLISYEVFGRGAQTVLCLAPGGMRSAFQNWSGAGYMPAQPIDPTSTHVLPHDEFTVIGMSREERSSQAKVPKLPKLKCPSKNTQTQIPKHMETLVRVTLV